ncbi:hypothetical protein KJB62_10740 [Staphylococcus saprophyticus]|uniref:hypothetical protein n=1 Tax=Staphylococcus saprophyticus TaxID=29385 RepID=UPI001F1933A5|nr:hypothetical protein [Staphylococcus saprophyticus]MCE5131867.1 hypothetical protein [Staphylococcus saprophyticus]
MNKKVLITICLIFVLSVVIFISTKSFYNSQNEALDIEKSNYEQYKTNIKQLKDEEKLNRAVISKSKDNPNILGEEAKDTSKKLLDKLIKYQNYSDDKKTNAYKNSLDNVATSDLYEDGELKNIIVPEKYEMFIGTSRGSNIEVLVKSKENEKDYITLEYDSAEQKISSIKKHETRES